MIVPLNSPLAFKPMWFRDWWSSNSLLILKLLMNFSSANLILEEKAGLTFHICKIPWQRVSYSNCIMSIKNQILLFCFMFYFLQGNLFPFQHLH